MEWFKLAANYADDPKIVAAGEQAELLFVRALAYCAREETAGFVGKNLVKRLTPSNANRRATTLVKVGLWVEVEDGYQIKRWTDWQSELDALAARRQSDRERKRAQREREAAARVESDAAESRDESRDMQGGQSRDILRMSHDVTPGEVRSKEPTNQNDPRLPGPIVPGPRSGGGADAPTGPADITHEAEAVALLAALNPARLRPGRGTVENLAADVAQLLALGWPAAELQTRMTEDAPNPVRNLGGFLRSRLPKPTRYTQSAAAVPLAAPAWCGSCHEPTRMRETDRGMQRCPDCSPLTQVGRTPGDHH